MTALERITQLSGLSGVSAAQHLKQIAGAAGIAGALLVAFSGLPTGTAAEHLLANGGTPPPVTGISYGGGFGGHFHENVDRQAERARRKKTENEAVVMAIVQFVLEQS